MAHPGTAHLYTPTLLAFEHASPHPSTALNTLLFIGGLSDGLLTVPYPRAIASALPSSWRLAEVLLTSSYGGWASGRIAQDAREIAECVEYFRGLRKGQGGKVVLMGHSTGCQDIMAYLVGKGAEGRGRVEGVIMQGGVSDRQAWSEMCKTEQEQRKLGEVLAEAKRMMDNGDEEGIVSLKGNSVAKELGNVSAYRTHSLLAPGGDDDFFSDDLSDAHLASTFGRIGNKAKVCFLLGSLDPYVPGRIDKAGLLGRWTRVIREGGGSVDDVNGGVVEGAHHNLDGDPEEVVADLVGRVVGFVEGFESVGA